MSTRKTAQDLLTERNKLQKKLSALDSRIVDRCKEMVKKFPNVNFGIILMGKFRTNGNDVDVKFVCDQFDLMKEDYKISMAIKIIKRIELHNLLKTGHVQTTMFPQS